MDLDWLKDFIALADLGSFSRAADRRNVTQPAFSRRVRALEEWIGTALFTRGSQGAELTAAGRHLLPQAEQILNRIERVRLEVAEAGESDARSLTIAATHALSFTFFPSWIRTHVTLERLGALSLLSDGWEACETAMLAGKIHFLLCHFHVEVPSRLDAERFERVSVGSEILVPVSAPTTPGGPPAWPIPGIARKTTRLLAYGPGSGLGGIIAAHRPTANATDGLETVFTSHLAATLRKMALEGEGAAWLPRSLIEEDLSSGSLVRAAPESLDLPVEITLFRSPDCRNQAADALWQALLAGSSAGGAHPR